MSTSAANRAIVRGVPPTFDRCIRPEGSDRPIDVTLAAAQHAAYCDTLRSLGLDLLRIEADDRYPDCCFVEDTVFVVGDTVFVCEMGAASRRGEGEAVVGELAGLRLVRLDPPATIDGGDVIYNDGTLFVGLSARTNADAVRQVKGVLDGTGVQVIPVPVTDVLHLKSACTPVAPGVVLVSEACASADAFTGCERLAVPANESYAANCLSIGGTVIVSEGFPRTRELLESRGYPTVALNMSEFRKGGGSLTCLSIVFQD